ncbi:CamS family sex pheromone protein [Metabacillus malikii]
MVLSSIFVLTACAPNFGEQEEIVQETEDDSKEQAIIPKYNKAGYYQTPLSQKEGEPSYKPGEARGVVAENLNTRLDIDEFETGLMRIAQDTFSPDTYLFQEGQYLKGDVINSWLKRQKTAEEAKVAQAELDEKKKDEKYTELGLNPALPEGEPSTLEQRNQDNPIYLAHIIEHNYLIRKDDDAIQLDGMVIGLAMNSVHYYKQKDGFEREHKIPRDVLLEKGKEIAEKVLQRMRNTKGVGNVPIVFAIYEQEEKKSIVPGNFIAKAEVKQGSNSFGKWETIDEDYVFFPSPGGTQDYREDAQRFDQFKGEIESFFPNYTGVIGKAFYKNGEMNYIDIEIPMQFYSKGEVIAFTQFVASEVMEYFPDYISLEVNIMSNSGQEALILREPKQDEPTVHIYK